MPAPRRRRAALLLSLALACGGLAAAEVGGRAREVEARVGLPVAVLVSARDLAPGDELTRSDLAVREVPERFAPPDALVAPEDAVGLRVGGPLAKGAYLTTASVGNGTGKGEGRAPGELRTGERAVEVTVAGGEALAGAAPGSRVDVLVSTDPGEDSGRTLLALEQVELLDLHPGAGTAEPVGVEGDAENAKATGSALATLRVSVRQAVYLTAAQNFAREVRLLARPAGDRGRSGREVIGADGL